MKHRIGTRAICIAALLFLADSAVAQTVSHDTVATERVRKQIAGTVASLEETVRQLQVSPDNFGGRRVAALASSRQAVQDLKRILEYRRGEQ